MYLLMGAVPLRNITSGISKGCWPKCTRTMDRAGLENFTKEVIGLGCDYSPQLGCLQIYDWLKHLFSSTIVSSFSGSTLLSKSGLLKQTQSCERLTKPYAPRAWSAHLGMPVPPSPRASCLLTMSHLPLPSCVSCTNRTPVSPNMLCPSSHSVPPLVSPHRGLGPPWLPLFAYPQCVLCLSITHTTL